MPPAARRFTHRNLPLLLLRARELVMARFRPILNAHGLTEQQWRVLRGLLENGPMEPRQIVDACVISSPSLAGVLSRMEELGLVSRERLDHDQRRLKVSLTPRSRGLVQRMAPEVEAAYAQLEKDLGAGGVDELYALLDSFVGRLDERADSAAALDSP